MRTLIIALVALGALGALRSARADADRVQRDHDPLVDDLGDARCRVEHAATTPARGCRRHVRRWPDRIELVTSIGFDLDKATLRPASFAIVREVAQVLLDHPDLAIEIQGHDGFRCDYCAIPLSKRRAEAVRDFLVDQGVAADRLQAVGYDDTRPIVVVRTPADRRRNSRIELHVVAPAAP